MIYVSFFDELSNVLVCYHNIKVLVEKLLNILQLNSFSPLVLRFFLPFVK